LTPIDVRDPGEIERAITAFARERNGGLIVTAGSAARTHRALIISLAMQHRLPNVFPYRHYPSNGDSLSLKEFLVRSRQKVAQSRAGFAQHLRRAPDRTLCTQKSIAGMRRAASVRA
jgi:hypothetical protein